MLSPGTRASTWTKTTAMLGAYPVWARGNRAETKTGDGDLLHPTLPFPGKRCRPAREAGSRTQLLLLCALNGDARHRDGSDGGRYYVATCYKLHPKFICGKPDPHCDDIFRWDLWEVLQSCGWGLMKGIKALIRDPRSRELPSPCPM